MLSIFYEPNVNTPSEILKLSSSMNRDTFLEKWAQVPSAPPQLWNLLREHNEISSTFLLNFLLRNVLKPTYPVSCFCCFYYFLLTPAFSVIYYTLFGAT